MSDGRVVTEFLSSPEMVAGIVGAILAGPFVYLRIRREQRSEADRKAVIEERTRFYNQLLSERETDE